MISPATLQPTYTIFNNLIQYKPLNVSGGAFTVYPQVLYNGTVYQYTGWGTPISPATNPITYKTPDIDSSAIPLYNNADAGNRAYASILLNSGLIGLNGNISLAGTSTFSSNITLGGSGKLLNIPSGTSLMVAAQLYITTQTSSGVTFTITANNATAQSQSFTVGASVTSALTSVNAIITSVGANASIGVTASNVTGAGSIVGPSALQVWQIS